MRECFADQVLGDLDIRYPFAQVQMQDRPSGIKTLQFILQIKRFKNIIGEADW